MLATIGSMLIVGGIYSYYEINTYEKNKNKICSPKELNMLSGDGIKCSKNFRLSTQQSNEHVLLIAPCGAGKSTRFFKPNVMALGDSKCSLVVTDPCGEIERDCEIDKTKYVLNPFSENTIGYDPLLNCKNEFEVRKVARTILMNGSLSSRKGNATNQQDWIEMAIPLFTAYLLYCYHLKKYNFGEVIENICSMPILPYKDVEDCNSIYTEIMSSEFDSAKIEINSFLQVMGARQTLSSIRSVLNTCLQVFLDDRIKNIFVKPNLDFSKLRSEKSILYVQIPERHSEYFAPLSATFMSQLIDSFLDNDGLQIYMMFDEFCNIGKIGSAAEFCNTLSTIRKHEISITAGIQNITQLIRTYGEIEGKELRELFKTILVTGGLKDSTEYVSDLLGTTDRHYGDTWHTEPLMNQDQIRRMKSDDMLIICNNKRPVIDKMLNPIFTVDKQIYKDKENSKPISVKPSSKDRQQYIA